MSSRNHKDLAGSWAVITGASEGLGKSFAIECAGLGMNLMLAALPGDELNYLANAIQRDFEVDVMIFPGNLADEQTCIDFCDRIKSAQIPVKMVVNNVGLGHNIEFEYGSMDLFLNVLKLNTIPTTIISKLLIPELVKNSPAYILNVGSLSSFFPIPRKSVYGASKAYLYAFSRNLATELKEKNIQVSVLCPGGMNTNGSQVLMNKYGNFLTRMSVLSPDIVAKFAIKNMLKGKEVIVPGLLTKLSLIVQKALPEFIMHRLSAAQMKKSDLGGMKSLKA